MSRGWVGIRSVGGCVGLIIMRWDGLVDVLCLWCYGKYILHNFCYVMKLHEISLGNSF